MTLVSRNCKSPVSEVWNGFQVALTVDFGWLIVLWTHIQFCPLLPWNSWKCGQFPAGLWFAFPGNSGFLLNSSGCFLKWTVPWVFFRASSSPPPCWSSFVYLVSFLHFFFFILWIVNIFIICAKFFESTMVLCASSFFPSPSMMGGTYQVFSLGDFQFSFTFIFSLLWGY